jgi:hypothetical protein
VSLDPQLALRDVVSASIYVHLVVRKGYDVTNFELILVVIEHEMS